MLAGAAALGVAGIAQAQSPQRILFIGNSLTYYNFLPDMLQAVFAGVNTQIETQMVANGGYTLDAHWSEGDAQEAIASGPWNVVVLQEGRGRGGIRRSLRRNVARYAPLIAAAGARTALYSTYPSRTRMRELDSIAEAYEATAAETGAVLFPVSRAWAIAHADVSLYAPDGGHPNALGSYLAALVMFAVLTQRSPVGLPQVLTYADRRQVRVPDEAIGPLQRAAAEATGL